MASGVWQASLTVGCCCVPQHLHSAAVDALSTVTMTPSVSRHRLEAMVSSRTEWCISRQRSWGVPIPVLYDTET